MTAPVALDFARPPSVVAYMVRGALPAARRLDLAPPISARWTGHRIDPRGLAAFHRITGLPAGSTLHLLAPHTFGFRLLMTVLTHPAFPVPIWGVLQTRNHLLQHRPIAVDARLDLETRVAAGRVVARGAEIDLHTRVHAGGALAWESLVTFSVRGRFGEPGPAAPLARAPVDLGPAVAGWRMSDDDHWRFGGLTGDYNGIHVWDWYARRFGFPRALYHPPRVIGRCLAELGPAAAGWPQRLDVWLKGPVTHGADVRLHARTGGGATTFALFARDQRPAIVGRVGRAEETGTWNGTISTS